MHELFAHGAAVVSQIVGRDPWASEKGYGLLDLVASLISAFSRLCSLQPRFGSMVIGI